MAASQKRSPNGCGRLAAVAPTRRRGRVVSATLGTTLAGRHRRRSPRSAEDARRASAAVPAYACSMTSVTSDGKMMLQRIARRAMTQRGLLPEFSPAALQEADALSGAAVETGPGVRDLRGLLWASIDNDDSRDLDAERGFIDFARTGEAPR